MNVSLTPELEKFVRARVASGLYNNASEVVREALRLLYKQTANRHPPEKSAVLQAIRRVERELRGKGVTALYLFGSIARDQATPASDVDILIDVDANSRFSLLDQAGVQSDLADALGHPVDVILKKGLRKELRNAVLNEATRVF